MSDMTPINRSHCVLTTHSDLLTWETYDGRKFYAQIDYDKMTGMPAFGSIIRYTKPPSNYVTKLWEKFFGGNDEGAYRYEITSDTVFRTIAHRPEKWMGE